MIPVAIRSALPSSPVRHEDGHPSLRAHACEGSARVVVTGYERPLDAINTVTRAGEVRLMEPSPRPLKAYTDDGYRHVAYARFSWNRATVFDISRSSYVDGLPTFAIPMRPYAGHRKSELWGNSLNTNNDQVCNIDERYGEGRISRT